MNILLINHYAGSPTYGMEFRPYYMAREWIKMGHNVFIISSSYSHLRIKQPPISRDFEQDVIDGIYYIWIKTPKYKSSFSRIINIITFVLKLIIYKNYISKISHPDIVIASSTIPLDVFPAKMISRNNASKLCFEVHDLWPLSPMEIGGYSKWHPYIMLIQFAENYAYKNSDLVISLLKNSKEYMVQHGMRPEKFFYVPNGYSKEEKKNPSDSLPEEHLELFKYLNRKNRFIVGFAGGIEPSSALDKLLETAYLLKDWIDIVFIIVGNGSCIESLKEKTKELHLNNVFFLPAVKKENVLQIVCNFDVCYDSGIHSLLHKYGTSFNKITDYMLCSKPIVFSVDDPDSLIKLVNCGISVPAENPKEVSKAILNLFNLSPNQRHSIGDNGRMYAETNLEYSILAKKMLSYIINN